MDRVQRNGGTAGIVTGLLLALLFAMIFMLGQDAMTPGDPAKVLSVVTQKWGLFAAVNFVGLLASGAAIPFVVGIATRLRDAAPTRARTVLYSTLIGLGAYALGSIMMWQGGHQVVEYAVKDQAGATTAWLALFAVNTGLSGVGNVFTGAGTLVAGWAIIGTGAMGVGVGWVGIVAGALGILTLFAPTMPAVFLGSFALTIVWALWAGSELMRGKASK